MTFAGMYTKVSNTDDTGPVKPGNRVEGKTLEIREVVFERYILCRDPAVKNGR